MKNKGAKQLEQKIEIKDVETACLKEVEASLKKHNCSLNVHFEKDTILGQGVLKYRPIITFNK